MTNSANLVGFTESTHILLQVQVRGVSGDGVLGVADPAGKEGHGTELLLSTRTSKGQSNKLNILQQQRFGAWCVHELSYQLHSRLLILIFHNIIHNVCPLFQVMAVDLTQSGEEFGSEISITRGPNFETAVL